MADVYVMGGDVRRLEKGQSLFSRRRREEWREGGGTYVCVCVCVRVCSISNDVVALPRQRPRASPDVVRTALLLQLGRLAGSEQMLALITLQLLHRRPC